MKRIQFILAVAMTLAAASCQKEVPAPQDSDSTQTDELVFRASLEGAQTTRSTIDSAFKISWEDTDEISISGITFVAHPDGDNKSLATFTKKNPSDPDPSKPYKAYYPATIFNGTDAFLPSVQQFVKEGSISSVLPMYAYGTQLSLNFKHLCGLIKFTLKGTETLRDIVITDDECALCGKFTVNDNGEAVLDASARGGITLDCGTGGVQLNSQGKCFYAAVPVGSYSHLRFEYNTLNYAEHYRVKSGSAAVVERRTVYPFEMTPKFKADYLCFTVLEGTSGSVSVSKTGSPADISLEYSTDGAAWQDYTVGDNVGLPASGSKVYFRSRSQSDHFSKGASDYYNFSIEGVKVKVTGNVMYLLSPDSPGTAIPANYSFKGLFSSQSDIVDASGFKLPATTLRQYCYSQMFYNCTNLTAGPALPATTLAACCYQDMYHNDTSLETAPTLPATELKAGCYRYMYQGCSKLSSVTMFATSVSANNCLDDWLKDAGSDPSVASAILKVDRTMTSNSTISSTLPEAKWSIAAGN